MRERGICFPFPAAGKTFGRAVRGSGPELLVRVGEFELVDAGFVLDDRRVFFLNIAEIGMQGPAPDGAIARGAEDHKRRRLRVVVVKGWCVDGERADPAGVAVQGVEFFAGGDGPDYYGCVGGAGDEEGGGVGLEGVEGGDEVGVAVVAAVGGGGGVVPGVD